MIKVRCDGYTVYVCRDPADAFPLFLRNEERQFKAGMNVLRHASGELSGGNKTKAEQLLVRLNDANQSLQADFNAIYTVFASDPCRDRDYLEKKIDEIRHGRIYMETLLTHVRAIQVAIENGTTAEMAVPAIERAFAATMNSYAREAVTLIQQAPSEVQRWRQPFTGPYEEDAGHQREIEPREGFIRATDVVDATGEIGKSNGGDDDD